MAAGTDLRIVTYTAAVGTTDAEKMDALRVSCAQSGPDTVRAMSVTGGPS